MGFIIGLIVLSTMFYFMHQDGKESAYKEMQEKTRDDEISELKRQINDLKRKTY